MCMEKLIMCMGIKILIWARSCYTSCYTTLLPCISNAFSLVCEANILTNGNMSWKSSFIQRKRPYSQIMNFHNSFDLHKSIFDLRVIQSVRNTFHKYIHDIFDDGNCCEYNQCGEKKSADWIYYVPRRLQLKSNIYSANVGYIKTQQLQRHTGWVRAREHYIQVYVSVKWRDYGTIVMQVCKYQCVPQAWDGDSQGRQGALDAL